MSDEQAVSTKANDNVIYERLLWENVWQYLLKLKYVHPMSY